MPDSYAVDGRWGYRQDCAWWAFRQVSKLALLRWQEMTKDIEKVWRGIGNKAFADQGGTEEQALLLIKRDPSKARAFLTEYCSKTANAAVDAYRKLHADL